MEQEAVIRELVSVFSCPLCEGIFRSPLQFSSCSHAFCRECIFNRLEGKGITKSECPICHQPAWKKDLVSNPLYGNIASILEEYSKIPCEQHEEKKVVTRKSPLKADILPQHRTRRKSRFGPTTKHKKEASDKHKDHVGTKPHQEGIDTNWIRDFVEEVAQADSDQHRSMEATEKVSPEIKQDDWSPYDFDREVLDVQAILADLEFIQALLQERGQARLETNSDMQQESCGPEFEFSILGSLGMDGMAKPSKHFRQAKKSQQENSGQGFTFPTLKKGPLPLQLQKPRSPLSGNKVSNFDKQEKIASGYKNPISTCMETQSSLTDIDAAMRDQGFRFSAMTEQQ